jgi:hypothetical protein
LRLRSSGILDFSYLVDYLCVDQYREKPSMHDFLIALAFVGMVIAPAIVAANSNGNSAAERE